MFAAPQGFFTSSFSTKLHRKPGTGPCGWEGKSALETERMALLMTFTFLVSVFTFYRPSRYMNRKL